MSLESHISYFKIQKHVQEGQGHVDLKCTFVLYFCFELEFMLLQVNILWSMKKCLQYACFYLCNFINFDGVGHWPNSTQHVHLCMCVVGCVCIYLCLCDVKIECFCLDVLWTLDYITKYRWFLYFFLGINNQYYNYDKVDKFEIMVVLTGRDSS